jgi:hypothetical protein
MARTDNLNNFLTDVANAIRAKTGGTGKIQASQFDTEINKLGEITPNGIIESYYVYAGENISAGDFVNFVNGIAGSVNYGASVDTVINTTKYASERVSAVELPNNRVFIAHGTETSLLYGVIVTIDNSTITVGTIKKLGDIYTGKAISVALLKDGRIFIAHSSGETYNSLYGMVCTVNGTTITKVYDKNISGANLESNKIETIVLDSDNNDVFIAYRGESTTETYLCMIVCRVGASDLTKGTVVKIGNQGGAGISATALSDGRICVAHYYHNTNNYKNALYAKIITVTDLTITYKGFIVDNTNYCSSSSIQVVALEGQKVLVVNKPLSGNAVYAHICLIEGDNATVGERIELLANGHDCYSLRAIPVRLSSDKVLLVYGRYSDYYLYGVVCTVQDMTISVGTATALIDSVKYSGVYNFSLLLSSGSVLVTHCGDSTNRGLNGQLFSVVNDIPTNEITVAEYETQVKKATSIPFDGIAKTSGSGGTEELHNEQVEVYTLQG